MFGPTYINEFILIIFAVEHKTVLARGPSYMILIAGKEGKATAILFYEVLIHCLCEHKGRSAVKIIAIMFATGSPVVAVTSECGISTIEWIPATKPTQYKILPGGLHEA